MAQLRQDAAQFAVRDAEIIIVGPENAQAFAEYWGKEKLPFIGLPDPTASVLKLYGQEVNLFKLGRMPAQVIVDRGGVARFVHYGHSMSDIPTNEELVEILDGMNGERRSSARGETLRRQGRTQFEREMPVGRRPIDQAEDCGRERGEGYVLSGV